MKVVLFCGGLGTRLREYSDTIPKPLVPIGPRPILWHVMKYYAHHGHRDFVLCLGHRGEQIKEFFLHYNECLSNDFRLADGGRSVTLFSRDIDDWTVSFVDTGLNANIGQRLKAVERHLDGEDTFLANYADGLSDVPLGECIDRLQQSPDALGCFVTVRPSHTFHGVHADAHGIVQDIRPGRDTDLWVNGGFFVLRRAVLDYIKDGEELVEEPFLRLIAEQRLLTYRHTGFWQSMDTFKDKMMFDTTYARGETPWMVWKR
jgi:glucose-1-phosphate cytidylyltransferase